MRVVTASEALKSWRAPLAKWFDVLDDYNAAQTVPDVAYWYNERATLSTLAGALWLSGCLVLEEYRTSRGAVGPFASTGRADMWCRIAGKEYTVEAKQDAKLSYPREPAKLAKTAEAQLAFAAAQCATDDFAGPNRLALVFMVPSLGASPRSLDIDGWATAIESFDAELKAIYLNVPAIESPRNGRFFPGVILLGRPV